MVDRETRIAEANDRMVRAYRAGNLPAARAAMNTLYKLVRERNAEQQETPVVRLR